MLKRFLILLLAVSRMSRSAINGHDADFQRAVMEVAQWGISGSELRLLTKNGRLLLLLERVSGTQLSNNGMSKVGECP